MTEDRIITAATVTSGEKNDGKQLKTLIQTGIQIEDIIGDSAYSEKGNIEFAKENKINLVAKLNPSVTQGYRKKEDEFEFNKDAGMYVCKAGHMAIRKARQGKRDKLLIKQVHTILMLKNANIVLIKKGVTKKEQKQKVIRLVLNPLSIQPNLHFKKLITLKKNLKNVIK